MEIRNQSYETIFVVTTVNGDDAVKATVEKFTTLIASNGEITQVNDWGKRRLAYPINDLTEGYYTLVYFTAPANFAAELERRYNIDDNILRAIVLKDDEKVAKSAPVAVAAVVEEETVAPAEEAAVEVSAEETAE
ncbi:MAG: 30S ribosomal protein S6 [Clostridia bacterium]|nr:30S ribosomal protein S6 [Clostridia bacterium]